MTGTPVRADITQPFEVETPPFSQEVKPAIEVPLAFSKFFNTVFQCSTVQQVSFAEGAPTIDTFTMISSGFSSSTDISVIASVWRKASSMASIPI